MAGKNALGIVMLCAFSAVGAYGIVGSATRHLHRPPQSSATASVAPTPSQVAAAVPAPPVTPPSTPVEEATPLTSTVAPTSTRPQPTSRTRKPTRTARPTTRSRRPTTTRAPKNTAPARKPSRNASFVQRIVDLTNAERRKAGLKPFVRSRCLTKGAQKWSESMAQRRSLGHQDLGWILSDCDNRRAGENVAQGYRSPESMVEGWMGSPGHRANILNPQFKYLGVGYSPEGGGYATQNFGG